MVREVQQVAWGLGILLLVSCSAEGPLESEGELQQAATVQTACEGMTVPPPAPGRYKILQVTAGTDTTIREAQPSKNFRSENFCYTQFEADAAQACLIRFPIELPATAQIHYAQLGLQLTAASPTRVLAYSMDKRWTEAGATWNRYNSRTPWSTPGAQSDKRWSFCALTASTGHVTYNLGGAAVAQIQDWVSGRAENSGIGIFADATSGGREVSVVAHDASVDAPVLTLWYTDDPVEAQKVGLRATASTTIDKARPAENFSRSAACQVSRTPASGEQSCLLRWDTSSIPAGSLITGAAFNFGAPPSSNTRWDLYPLRQPWVESQVTWQVFATAMPWQVPGAWGAKDVKGTAGYLRPISTGPLLAGYIPLSLVQSWVDVPAGNRGAVFTTSRVLPGLGSELWTLTRDPTLTVTFTPPSP